MNIKGKLVADIDEFSGWIHFFRSYSLFDGLFLLCLV